MLDLSYYLSTDVSHVKLNLFCRGGFCVRGLCVWFGQEYA